jgi:hypothetical protein
MTIPFKISVAIPVVHMLHSPVEVLQTAGGKIQKIDHSWFSSSLVLYTNFKLDTPDQDAFVIEDVQYLLR